MKKFTLYCNSRVQKTIPYTTFCELYNKLDELGFIFSEEGCPREKMIANKFNVATEYATYVNAAAPYLLDLQDWLNNVKNIPYTLTNLTEAEYKQLIEQEFCRKKFTF